MANTIIAKMLQKLRDISSLKHTHTQTHTYYYSVPLKSAETTGLQVSQWSAVLLLKKVTGI